MKKILVVISLLAVSSFGTLAQAGTLAGYLDSKTPAIAGWACTVGESTVSTVVHLYLDGNFIMQLPGSRPSEPAVAKACGVPAKVIGTKNYRFSIAIGDFVKVVKAKGIKTGTYSLKAFAVSAAGSLELVNSGQSLYIP